MTTPDAPGPHAADPPALAPPALVPVALPALPPAPATGPVASATPSPEKLASKIKRFTTEEDRILLDLHAQHGRKWAVIAESIPGRSKEQIYRRWEYLKKLTKTPWTLEQDRKLEELYRQYGIKWKDIAKEMPGHSSTECRYRWKCRLDQERETSMLIARRSSMPPNSASVGETVLPERERRNTMSAPAPEPAPAPESVRESIATPQLPADALRVPEPSLTAELQPNTARAPLPEHTAFTEALQRSSPNPPAQSGVTQRPGQPSGKAATAASSLNDSQFGPTSASARRAVVALDGALENRQPLAALLAWSAAEDERLARLHDTHGDNWGAIARAMPQRSVDQIRFHWMTILDPSLTKASWTTVDDAMLQSLHSVHGDSWELIARAMKGRSSLHCRRRFETLLGDKLSNRQWTEEEDEELTRLFAEHSDEWTRIAEEMPGRNDMQCRERWVHGLPEKRSWVDDEDRKLLLLFQLYDDAWVKIAEEMDGRDEDQCFVHAHSLLGLPIPRERPFEPKTAKRVAVSRRATLPANTVASTTHGKRPWTPEERSRLVALRTEHGDAWFRISRALPSRTRDECREYFFASVSKEWTMEEERLLAGLVVDHPGAWECIADGIPERTGDECCHHWDILSRPLLNADAGLRGVSPVEPPAVAVAHAPTAARPPPAPAAAAPAGDDESDEVKIVGEIPATPKAKRAAKAALRKSAAVAALAKRRRSSTGVNIEEERKAELAGATELHQMYEFTINENELESQRALLGENRTLLLAQQREMRRLNIPVKHIPGEPVPERTEPNAETHQDVLAAESIADLTPANEGQTREPNSEWSGTPPAKTAEASGDGSPGASCPLPAVDRIGQPSAAEADAQDNGSPEASAPQPAVDVNVQPAEGEAEAGGSGQPGTSSPQPAAGATAQSIVHETGALPPGVDRTIQPFAAEAAAHDNGSPEVHAPQPTVDVNVQPAQGEAVAGGSGQPGTSNPQPAAGVTAQSTAPETEASPPGPSTPQPDANAVAVSTAAEASSVAVAPAATRFTTVEEEVIDSSDVYLQTNRPSRSRDADRQLGAAVYAEPTENEPTEEGGGAKGATDGDGDVVMQASDGNARQEVTDSGTSDQEPLMLKISTLEKTTSDENVVVQSQAPAETLVDEVGKSASKIGLPNDGDVKSTSGKHAVLAEVGIDATVQTEETGAVSVAKENEKKSVDGSGFKNLEHPTTAELQNLNASGHAESEAKAGWEPEAGESHRVDAASAERQDDDGESCAEVKAAEPEDPERMEIAAVSSGQPAEQGAEPDAADGVEHLLAQAADGHSASVSSSDRPVNIYLSTRKSRSAEDANMDSLVEQDDAGEALVMVTANGQRANLSSAGEPAANRRTVGDARVQLAVGGGQKAGTVIGNPEGNDARQSESESADEALSASASIETADIVAALNLDDVPSGEGELEQAETGVDAIDEETARVPEQGSERENGSREGEGTGPPGIDAQEEAGTTSAKDSISPTHAVSAPVETPDERANDSAKRLARISLEGGKGQGVLDVDVATDAGASPADLSVSPTRTAAAADEMSDVLDVRKPYGSPSAGAMSVPAKCDLREPPNEPATASKADLPLPSTSRSGPPAPAPCDLREPPDEPASAPEAALPPPSASPSGPSVPPAASVPEMGPPGETKFERKRRMLLWDVAHQGGDRYAAVRALTERLNNPPKVTAWQRMQWDIEHAAELHARHAREMANPPPKRRRIE